MLTFKQWLEWEGFNYLQEPDLVNNTDPDVKGGVYPRSKYKGPGEKDKSNSSKIDKMYGKVRKRFN